MCCLQSQLEAEIGTESKQLERLQYLLGKVGWLLGRISCAMHAAASHAVAADEACMSVDAGSLPCTAALLQVCRVVLSHSTPCNRCRPQVRNDYAYFAAVERMNDRQSAVNQQQQRQQGQQE